MVSMRLYKTRVRIVFPEHIEKRTVADIELSLYYDHIF